MNSLDERQARAINAEPWEPPTGMVKLRCTECGYWYAARRRDSELCPDCVPNLRRGGPAHRDNNWG